MDRGGQIKLGGQLVYGCDECVIRMTALEDILKVVYSSKRL